MERCGGDGEGTLLDSKLFVQVCSLSACLQWTAAVDGWLVFTGLPVLSPHSEWKRLDRTVTLQTIIPQARHHFLVCLAPPPSILIVLNRMATG